MLYGESEGKLPFGTARIGTRTQLATMDINEWVSYLRQNITDLPCGHYQHEILRCALRLDPYHLISQQPGNGRGFGVPVTLNTDDEGVNRSNLTLEFVRAVRTYHLSYQEVKELVRNSLEYSFLPGESLYAHHDYHHLLPSFTKIREAVWEPSPEAQKLLAASEKRQVQVRLERAFATFESE